MDNGFHVLIRGYLRLVARDVISRKATGTENGGQTRDGDEFEVVFETVALDLFTSMF